MRRKDEIWRIEHVRKGSLLVRLDEDVADDAEWFNAELLDGNPSMLSNEYRLGLTPHIKHGDVMSHRACLVRFIEQVPVEAFCE